MKPMDFRQEIIRQGCQLFANRGYDAISVQEIVDKVGVTKPTLYHYFGSKQGLLDAILALYLQPFNSQLNVASTYHNDLVLTLESITNLYFDFARTEPGFFRLWMTIRLSPAGSTAYVSLKPYLEHQHKLFVTLFEQASYQHGNLRDRQEIYAISFTGMISTYATHALQSEKSLNSQIAYQAVHQFMYGIFS